MRSLLSVPLTRVAHSWSASFKEIFIPPQDKINPWPLVSYALSLRGRVPTDSMRVGGSRGFPSASPSPASEGMAGGFLTLQRQGREP